MRELYPEIEPFSTHQLKPDQLHSIYFEECGNRNGLPVIFIHGGPGSGCNENHRRYFNPDKYRIIIFDQRGCNRSTPQGETRNNTTQFLIADVENIRQHLGIEKCLVFGGSWGATLGLSYAQAHPDRVSGMILRGTFLARQQDLDWFIHGGAKHIFPEFWTEFVCIIPEDERDDLVSAYYRRLHGDLEQEKITAAQAWSNWAGKLATYLLAEVDDEEQDIDKLIHEVSIETHYAKHNYFIEENQILSNVDKLPDVPVTIIHGRRDLTCTLDASWELHKAILHSELHIVEQGGHLAGEPVMTDALVTATDDMVKQLA